MIQWLKLTPAQAESLAALSATNPGPSFLTPILDVDGVPWLTADCKDDLETYAHYAAWLAEMEPTDEQPVFPVGEGRPSE